MRNSLMGEWRNAKYSLQHPLKENPQLYRAPSNQLHVNEILINIFQVVFNSGGVFSAIFVMHD